MAKEFPHFLWAADQTPDGYPEGEPHSADIATILDNPVLGDAAVFTPADIASVTHWYRSDLGITLSGPDVDVWADQVGSADLLTPGNMPAYNATDTDINNNPSLSFVFASSEYMETAGFDFVDGYEVYIIGAPTALAVNRGLIDSISLNNGHICTNATGTRFQMFAVSNGTITSTYDAVLNQWERFRLLYDGATTSQLQVNNVTITGNLGSVGGTGFRLCRAGQTNTRYIDMDIAEVVISTTKLGTTDNANLDSYFNTRYGVTIS